MRPTHQKTRAELLEVVREYETALRYTFECWRDRQALAAADPGPEHRGAVHAFKDMSRHALEALRQFHPGKSIAPKVTGMPPTRRAAGKARARRAKVGR